MERMVINSKPSTVINATGLNWIAKGSGSIYGLSGKESQSVLTSLLFNG